MVMLISSPKCQSTQCVFTFDSHVKVKIHCRQTILTQFSYILYSWNWILTSQIFNFNIWEVSIQFQIFFTVHLIVVIDFAISICCTCFRRNLVFLFCWPLLLSVMSRDLFAVKQKYFQYFFSIFVPLDTLNAMAKLSTCLYCLLFGGARLSSDTLWTCLHN